MQNERALAQKKDCHALEKLKIEMGMVGSIFELRPPNFVKMQIFWRHSNDIKMNFWNILSFKKYKKSIWVPVHSKAVSG